MRRVRVANRRAGGWWWRLPVLAVLWLAIAAPLVIAGALVLTLRQWAADLPPVPDLDAWRTAAAQTSVVVAADGSRLAEQPFTDGEVIGHRTLGTLEALPLHVIEAVLAAEDVRFFRHHGVDYKAVVRAAYINYQVGRVVEGASTITQQLARNLLPAEIGMERSVRRKVREALLARALEHRFPKREILATYLDFVFLGQGAYGVTAAARAYFDKDVVALTLPEAALLAGLIQAPARLDPYKNPHGAITRRNEILARMARAHLIDEPTRTAAVATPLALHRPRPSYGTRVPWYTEQVRAEVAGELGDELARGGLTIETAALPALGAALEAEARTHAHRWTDPVEGDPQIAAVVWDHHTGYVEALIGGLAWGADRFDRMLGSCRQPGSAWKPMVYGAALEALEITPGTPLRDAPIAEYDEITNVHWKPKSGHAFRGVVLAQDALAASLNAPAIDVFDRVGPGAVIALARRLGVTTPLAQVRPMALGASCVKPLELARAYAIIARRGWAVTPRLVVRIRRGADALVDAAVPEDPWLDPARRLDRLAATAGQDPAERAGAEGGQLIDARVAFQLQDMLTAVVTRGTATAASALHRPTAGKTGTTNDNTDAWFVGFTGRALASVWIGHDEPRTKLGKDGDGAKAALPLWMRAIRLAEGDRPRAALPGAPPGGVEQVTLDRETGLLAAPGAPGLAVWLRTGTAPTEVAGQPGTSPTDFGRSAREF